jgi:hypothetical protein
MTACRRVALSALALALAASVAFGVVSLGGSARSAVSGSGPLPGVTGNVARFQGLTGQSSLVSQAFLSWGQGVSPFGSPFAALFSTLGPVPMIHLGTLGRDGREAITPGAIAAGRGDAYLVALNEAVAGWGGDLYPADGGDEQHRDSLLRLRGGRKAAGCGALDGQLPEGRSRGST